MAGNHPDINRRFQGYRCVGCQAEFSPAPFRYTCDSCGENLDGVYDYKVIRQHWSRKNLQRSTDRSIWRYAPLLPVTRRPENRSLRVGDTPLVSVPKLAEELSLKNVWIKDDTRLPSGSLKDRATEVCLQHSLESGTAAIVAASTGNAAASLACLSAFYHRRAIILAPASAPPAKLTQILQYGALLCPVKGSYDTAFDLVVRLAEKMNWYSRNTGHNPVLSEGKKTVALEIAEQLNWQLPDYIFVPVGDGCIIGGVYKGFYDLVQLGWIEQIPELIAVQANGSAALVNALEADENLQRVNAATVADSISVDYPRDGRKALRAVRESGGFGLRVSDDEILDAQTILANRTGIFAEPAAAAAFAGLLKARGQNLLPDQATVAVLATGSGLKDIPAAQRNIRIPDPVNSDIESIQEYIKTNT